MRVLVNFRLVVLVGILLVVFVSCEKEPIDPPIPDKSEYIEISLKAVANNLYAARLIIPELDYNSSISGGGDTTHTWISAKFPFNRENCEGKTLAITMEVIIYPNGYPGDHIKKQKEKMVLICDEADEVVWSFYD